MWAHRPPVGAICWRGARPDKENKFLLPLQRSVVSVDVSSRSKLPYLLERKILLIIVLGGTRKGFCLTFNPTALVVTGDLSFLYQLYFNWKFHDCMYVDQNERSGVFPLAYAYNFTVNLLCRSAPSETEHG